MQFFLIKAQNIILTFLICNQNEHTTKFNILKFVEARKVIEIRYVEERDKEFWHSLDCHLPEKEVQKKVIFLKL